MVRSRSPVRARPTAFFNFQMGKLKLIFSFLFFFVFSSLVFAESQVNIISFSGDVEYRVNSFSEWQKVLSTGPVPSGGAVKTNIGLAKIQVGKSVFWLKENSAIEIEQVSDYFTSVAVVYGVVKADINVPKINSLFKLRTISASLDIQRAVVVVNSKISGEFHLDVLYGYARFIYNIPPKKGEREFTVVQGTSLDLKDTEMPYEVSVIPEKKENILISNWDPEIKGENRFDELKNTFRKKADIKRYISYVEINNSFIDSFIYKQRESDFESGRTLKDVHGNLVRVDQRLIRSDKNTLELFNIVKRKNYSDYSYSSVYSNKTGFKYNGGASSNRIDLFVITFNFNKALPESVNDWNKFFSEDSVKANWATFVSASLLNSGNVFFVGEAYKYDVNRDELINNTDVVGDNVKNAITSSYDNDVILTGVISKNDLNDIVHLNFVEQNQNNPTGNLVYKDNTSSQIGNAIWGLKDSKVEYTSDQWLYQLRADRFLKGGNSSNGAFWVSQENYIISNSGDISMRKDILDSSNSVFELVKNYSLESILYVKQDNSGSVSDSDYFGSYNIDTVLIGDVPFFMMEKSLSGIDKYKD